MLKVCVCLCAGMCVRFVCCSFTANKKWPVCEVSESETYVGPAEVAAWKGICPKAFFKLMLDGSTIEPFTGFTDVRMMNIKTYIQLCDSSNCVCVFMFVYLLYFNVQVGALFSLSCIITPIAQRAASQLSSQRWREAIAKRPKSLPGNTVYLFVCFTFLLPC